MASNDKATLIKRLSGSPGRGAGANTGLGTSDIVVPQFPELPGRLTEKTIAEFREQMERWRESLQAQFPVPQQTSTAQASTDAINAAVSAAVTNVTSMINALEQRINNIQINVPDTDTTVYTTPEDVKDIIKNARYVHFQGTPSALWVVNHNLGWKPSVTVVDMSQNVVMGDVNYIDDKTLDVTFSAEFSGYAYIN